LLVIVYPECFAIQGIARYLNSFLTNLPPDCPPLLLITGDEHPITQVYAGVQIERVPFARNRLTQLLWGIRVRHRLLELYRQGTIRSVNLHVPPLLPGICLPLAEVPTIVTVHTTCLGLSGRFYGRHYYQSDWSKPALLLRTLLERVVISRAKRTIVLTEQGRDELLRSGYTKPMTVVPNGVDARSFTPCASALKDFDVLFCGRFERRKGSRALVLLCKRLVAARSDLRICIVGGGGDEYVHARNALASYGENIRFTDDVPLAQMPRFYDRSRIYVSTSFYEGLPGTCLEAMAMSLPVVAWDLGFYSGLVKDGSTGYLVPPNDFDTMSSRVLQLLDDAETAASLGRNGRAVVLARYEWQTIAKMVLAQLQ
jgi:glycosyltransferase involved in cell wall biosynthesis